MNRSTSLLAGLLVCLAVLPAHAQNFVTLPRPKVKWTVMVYLCGDDPVLEDAAMKDFNELSRVPDSNSVNVVVQFDRMGSSFVQPVWKGMTRFWIRHNEFAETDSPFAFERTEAGVNMADEETLMKFVKWGTDNFPADHYALVIWSHGTGYRDFTSTAAPVPPLNTTAPLPLPVKMPAGVSDQSFKASSFDGTDALFNAELVRGVEAARVNKKLDIIAFDACLMGMMETAYAMHPIADIMVASEELVSGLGFEYEKFLQRLTASPNSDGAKIAGMIVETFRDFYAPRRQDTTLSAVSLTNVDRLAGEVSALSRLLKQSPEALRGPVQEARAQCLRYGLPRQSDPPGVLPFYHVDLRRFALLLSEDRRLSAEIRRAALTVSESIRKANVITPYAGTLRQGHYGSHGLAIYFPASESEYIADPFNHGAYEKPVAGDPDDIAFVRDHDWADFLKAYFAEVK